MKMKMRMNWLVLLLFTIISCSKDSPAVEETEGETGKDNEYTTLSLVDSKATETTKALYANLWEVQQRGTMFGHHDDLIYGRNWYTEAGRSDIKDVVGDYPAVFSVDVAEIMDDRSGTSDLNDDRIRTIKEARSRGEVIIANMHINNPLTGGDSWDNSSNMVAKEILTDGSATQIKYLEWLDKLADFANNLKDNNGDLIPIIFRPFHEHTQTWSWWGRSATTQNEFIQLWKFTIDYLKNSKEVHNFIYAISPQLDQAGSKDSFLFRWPGDDYVDFIGMDSYHGTNTSAFSTNLRNLSLLSQEKMMPCGVTETGVEGIRYTDGTSIDDYWTSEIGVPLTGKEISMVVLWRNKYDPNQNGHHYFAPFEGEETSENFLDFYNMSHILFSEDLPDMYTMPSGITIE
ncbi:glycoside hydrolase family 26 protein [Christiangramia sp.]|uniref:glycoside hydrolase family 26 protein n=1 Tax=Christiangramia sp. TaxID=1931228 RepID=UPI002628B76A|nr:glycosyl hydrolase [Christiangramia sp.]